MSNLYSNLRPVRNDIDGTWSVYATFFDSDEGTDGSPAGDTEWEVPEWARLDSEVEACEIIDGYEKGTLAIDLMPRHPSYYT